MAAPFHLRIVARDVFEYQDIAHSYFTGETFILDGAPVREIEPRGLAYLMIEVCESGTTYQTFVHNGPSPNDFGDEYFSSGRQPGAVGMFIHGVWCPQLLRFSFLGLRGLPHPLQCTPFSKGPRQLHSLNKFLVVHRGRNSQSLEQIPCGMWRP